MQAITEKGEPSTLSPKLHIDIKRLSIDEISLKFKQDSMIAVKMFNDCKESIMQQACDSKSLKKVKLVKEYIEQNFQSPQTFTCHNDKMIRFFIDNHQSMTYVSKLFVESIDKDLFFELMRALQHNTSVHCVRVKEFSEKVHKYQIESHIKMIKDLGMQSGTGMNVALDDIQISNHDNLKHVRSLIKNNKQKKIDAFTQIESLTSGSRKKHIFCSNVTTQHIQEGKTLNVFQNMVYDIMGCYNALPSKLEQFKHLIEFEVSPNFKTSFDVTDDFFSVLEYLHDICPTKPSINVVDPITNKIPIILLIIKMIDYSMELRVRDNQTYSHRRFIVRTDSNSPKIETEKCTPHQYCVSSIRKIMEQHHEMVTDIQDSNGVTLHAHLRMRGIITGDEQHERFGIHFEKNEPLAEMIESLPEDITNQIFSYICKDDINDCLLNYTIKPVSKFFARSVYSYQLQLVKNQLNEINFDIETFLKNGGIEEAEFQKLSFNLDDRMKYRHLRKESIVPNSNHGIRNHNINQARRIFNCIEFSRTCKKIEKEQSQSIVIFENMKEDNVSKFEVCIDHYLEFEDTAIICDYMDEKSENEKLVQDMLQVFRTNRGSMLLARCYHKKDTRCFSSILKMMKHDPKGIIILAYERMFENNPIVNMMNQKLILCMTKKRKRQEDAKNNSNESPNKKIK